MGAALLAGRHLGRSRRLRFGGSLRRRRLEAVLEVAEEGFEDEHASFEFPASRAVGSRRGGRGVHARSMPESKRKCKVNGNGVNGYRDY